MTDHNVRRVRRLIEDATTAISQSYFLLPVASADDVASITVYRERVYAYELYHQMRVHWPKEWAESFSLAGEIDKSRHCRLSEI